MPQPNASLTFRPLNDQLHWERYTASRSEASFLQSWNWGVFQEKLGKKILRIGIFRDAHQVGALLMVKEAAKRGSYLTVAGGPLVDWLTLNQTELRAIFQFLRQQAREERCLFVRFRPQALDTPELRQRLADLGLVAAPMHLTADLTLQLDLRQSEAELLGQMRKNTRYEIRRADKLGITTRLSQNPEDIRAFYDHQVVLAKKHHFVPFDLPFLLEQFRIFAADDQATLISSFSGETLLATAFVLFYNGEAVYHYGISTPANDRLPGSYACQWAAIQEAQRRGCTTYNFWGIAPEAEKNHRFAGVSLFKRGFGGTETAYLPAQDLPASPLYWFTHFFETLRKKSRHL